VAQSELSLSRLGFVAPSSFDCATNGAVVRGRCSGDWRGGSWWSDGSRWCSLVCVAASDVVAEGCCWRAFLVLRGRCVVFPVDNGRLVVATVTADGGPSEVRCHRRGDED